MPLLVDHDLVVLADVLLDLVVRPLVFEGEPVRRSEHFGVFDQDMVLQVVRAAQREAFRDLHVLAVRHVVEGHVRADAPGFHDELAAFPAAARVALVGGVHVLHGGHGLVQENPPHLLEVFAEDDDLPVVMDDLDRKERGHHGRHALGQAFGARGGQRRSRRVRRGLLLLQLGVGPGIRRLEVHRSTRMDRIVRVLAEPAVGRPLPGAADAGARRFSVPADLEVRSGGDRQQRQDGRCRDHASFRLHIGGSPSWGGARPCLSRRPPACRRPPGSR